MKLEEKTIEKKYVYRGKILSVRCDKVLASDGSDCFREFVEHSGGVGILPITENDEIIFVKQFRYAYGECVLEIPAGKKDPHESPLSCAVRELKEETGCVSSSISFLGEIYPTPGYTNEKLYIYLARDLQFEKQNLDEGEFLELIKMPFEKALQMVYDNSIKDAKTVIALLKFYTQIKK